MTPKLSICVPTYNSEKFIEGLLNNILSQSFTDYELLIVDDASKDNTVNIVEKFRLKDRRIRLYKNIKNLGISDNMNKCLSLAQGKYINLMGHDDLMLEDSLKKRIDFLENNKEVGFVCSNIYQIDAEDKIISEIWSNLPKENTIFDSKTTFRRLIEEGNFICHSAVIVRRECHDRYGFYDARFPSCQDYEMWTRLALHYPLGYIAQPLIKYRWHANNITITDFRGKNALKGKEQNCLTRYVALEHYQELALTLKFYQPLEIKKLYQSIGMFYFWINHLKMSREVFNKCIQYHYADLKTFIYYLLSFFPEAILKFLKQLKNPEHIL